MRSAKRIEPWYGRQSIFDYLKHIEQSESGIGERRRDSGGVRSDDLMKKISISGKNWVDYVSVMMDFITNLRFNFPAPDETFA